MSRELITNFNSDWIKKGFDKHVVEKIESFGKYLCDLANKKGRNNSKFALTTNQFRNFFGEVKRIQLLKDNKLKAPAFVLLKPKIAYSAARIMKGDNRFRIKDFKELVDKAYNAVDCTESSIDEKQFQNFVNLLEAILAYHKVYIGKD